MRRSNLVWLLLAGVLACNESPPQFRTSANVDTAAKDLRGVPLQDLYKVAPDSTILRAARALMLTDSNVAVVTVDSEGQPRVRTTKAFVAPVVAGRNAAGVTVWIMTRLDTRKVEQIRRHPQVTLYFNNDSTVEYTTIMGTGVIHTDPEHPQAKAFYKDGYAEFFWPDFPRDFVMIEVRPRWLEYLGPTIPAHPRTWRPQAVVFPPSP